MTAIIICGYMTGDCYSTAALLAIDSTLKAILVKNSDDWGEGRDRSTYILGIFRQTGVLSQVSVLDIKPHNLSVEDFWHRFQNKGAKYPEKTQQKKQENQKSYGEIFEKAKAIDGDLLGITRVTERLANAWAGNRGQVEAAIAKAWSIPGANPDIDSGILDLVNKLTARSVRTKYIVVWSRQSAKRGAAHIELDSSYYGIRQIVQRALELGYGVILAGDDDKGKAENLSRGNAHIINITEIWKMKEHSRIFGTTSFLAQLALFKSLNGKFDIVHIGMRSGMLEPMALLGMRVFYIESSRCSSTERMVKFSEAGITYNRIVVADAPTATGRIAEQRGLWSVAVLNKRIVQEKKWIENRIPSDPRQKELVNSVVNTKNAAKTNLYDGRRGNELREPTRGFKQEDIDKIFVTIGSGFVRQ